MSINRPYNVLLVEDNPGDVVLMQEAFKHATTPMKWFLAVDGEKALEFLQKKGKSEETPIPDLVLLDLRLPKKNGLEVLKEMKNDNDLKSIPVLVVSTSQRQEDIRRSYLNHANAYVTKPQDLDDYLQVAQAIDAFWMQVTESSL